MCEIICQTALSLWLMIYMFFHRYIFFCLLLQQITIFVDLSYCINNTVLFISFLFSQTPIHPQFSITCMWPHPAHSPMCRGVIVFLQEILSAASFRGPSVKPCRLVRLIQKQYNYYSYYYWRLIHIQRRANVKLMSLCVGLSNVRVYSYRVNMTQKTKAILLRKYVSLFLLGVNRKEQNTNVLVNILVKGWLFRLVWT